MALPVAMLVAVLGATPASLEVSRELGARLDVSVLEARLVEEGFVLTPQAGAKVRLVVAPHPRGVELMAFAGARRFSRIVDAPDAVWPVERTFELSQRLASLAHEAAAVLGDEDAISGESATERSPPVEPPPPPAAAPLEAHARKTPAFGLVLRPGLLARAGGVDFAVQALAVLRLGRLEPALALGFVVAPDVGGTAFEIPLLAGVRVVLQPGDAWRLSPEVLIGLRVHLFPSLDGVVRGDPALQLGVSARRQLSQRVALGLSIAGLVAAARTHLLGTTVLWERGVVGLLVGAELEF